MLIVWLATDACLFLAAYVCAYLLRIGRLNSTDFPLDRYLQAALATIPVWIIIMILLGIFRLTRVQSSKKNILHSVFASTMALSFFTLAYYFIFNAFFSRLLLIYAGIFSVVLTTIWHLAFDVWQRKVLRKDPPAYPLLLVGINRDTERIIKLLNDRESVFKPVAILDSRGTSAKEIAGVPVLGRLHKLEEIIREKRITHLMQCAEIEHTINLLSVCRAHKLTYLLLPSVLGIVGVNEKSDQIEGQSVIMVG